MKRLLDGLFIIAFMLAFVNPTSAALYGDGSGDYAAAADSSDWDITFNSGYYSWSFWVFNDDLTARAEWDCIFWSMNNGSSSMLNFYAGDGRGSNRVEVYGYGSVDEGFYMTPNDSIAEDTWYHIACVLDGSQAIDDRVTIYINGVSQPIGRYKPGPDGNLTPTTNQFLTWDTTEYANGAIAEAYYWKGSALDQNEVSALYNGGQYLARLGLQIDAATLKGYWPFDDGVVGTSANGGSAYDLSGNAHTATATNCTWYGAPGGHAGGYAWLDSPAARKLMAWMRPGFERAGTSWPATDCR